MLDMGFIEDIETIVGRLPQDRQTLLFSATLDGTIAKLAARMMRDPQRIEMAGAKEKHTNITQSLLYADDASHKMQLLDHVLRDASLDQAIVFTSTKRGADDLADRLADQGFAAAALHGDMNQRQRTRTLSQLQRGQLRILVATDVAARGIDVQGISHAVNFDLPMQAEDYVHRIGRTGRAGRNGLAFTLATHSERHKVRRIEHYIGQSINPEVIAGLEPKRTPRPSTGGAPRGGKPFGKRPGGGYQGQREGRSFGGPRGEFKPREGGYQGNREGAPREGGYQGNRPFGDRPARSFSDRPSFGDRPQREGGYQGNRPFGDRPQREGGFRGGDRDSRPSFGDRPSYGDRPQRDARPFSERGPREGGFRGGDRDARPSFSDRPSFGDRPQREGGFRGGDRPEGGFRGKPSFDKRPGGPAKRFAKPAGARRD
jgi:superfamily II DNA/RNA helicase